MPILRAVLDRPGEHRDLFADSARIPSNSEYGSWDGDSGEVITSGTALSLVAVFACVRLIAETLASLPIGCFRGETPIGAPAWTTYPNVEQDWFEFAEQVVGSTVLDGNGYIRVVRGSTDDVTELWPLHPQSCTPYRHGNQTLYRLFLPDSGRTLEGLTPVAPKSGAFEGDILHVKAFAQPGDLKGINPIERARLTLGLARAADRFGAGFFGRGTTMSGVIQTPDPKTGEQARELADGFAQHHAGGRNAHRPGVLSGGATWQSLSVPPEHAQFLETRQYGATEVARLFRVPPSKIGADEGGSLTYNNPEMRSIEFRADTMTPWAVRHENAFGRLLVRGQRLAWNFDGLLRPDSSTRWQTHEVARSLGARSVNEIRRIEGEPPIPGGDNYDPPAPMPSQDPTTGEET